MINNIMYIYHIITNESLTDYTIIETIDPAKIKKAEYITKQFVDRWKGLPGFESLDTFIDAVANTDPTRNGAMMPWIARLAFKNPTVNKTEDFNRLSSDLQNFEKFKQKLDNKDINSYKTYQDVFRAVEPLLIKSPAEIKAERKAIRDANKIAKFKNEIITVVNNAAGWIRIPTTKAAAQFIGQGTRWCTSARNQNQFDSYNKRDKLFIIFDKKTRKRFQLHIDSDDFADASDTMHDFSTIPVWTRIPIVNWYKENVDMTLKQIMTLTKLANIEDIADTNNKHNELFQLMKQYEI